MGHMSSDEDHYTVTVHWEIGSQSQSETYRGCTNVDTNDDELTFDDTEGKRHQFCGVVYHIVEE